MPNADASGTILHIGEETTFGTAAAAATIQRFTGEDLNFSPDTLQSQEINPNADVTDLLPVGGSSQGNINYELSYGTEFHTLLEHALRGTFGITPDFNLDAAIEKKSLTIAKLFDVGAGNIRQFLFTGARVANISMQIQPRQIVTGQIGIRALQPAVGTVAEYGAPTAANTNPVMRAANVGSIAVAGYAGTFQYTDFSWQLENNLRDQNQLGDDDPFDIGYGQRVMTGSLIAYFGDDGLNVYNAMLNNTPFSLQFDLADAATNPNIYNLEFPRLKFASGRIIAQGNNQDVFAEMTWTATRGTLTTPAGNSGLRIVRTDAT